MFTRAFWAAAAERALKTAAQFALAAVGQDVLDVNLFQADLGNVAAVSATGFVLSILASMASAQIGVHGSPSLAAEAEVEAATDGGDA